MSLLKCIIVEDNPKIRKRISSYVIENEHCELLVSSFDLASILITINKDPNALLLLDIELKNENSIEFIKNNMINNPILFITGYKDYAYEALQLNFRGYLTKPLTQFVFNRKIKELFHQNIQQEIYNKKEPFLYINHQYKKVKILFNELLYTESQREYMHFYTLKGKYSTLMTFKTLEKILISNNFVRIHNSYMVNSLHITEIVKSTIIINTTVLPIGRSYKNAALKAILG